MKEIIDRACDIECVTESDAKAVAALADLAVQLQSRLESLENDAAQKLDLGSIYHAWNALEINRAGFDWPEFVTTANSAAMKG